MRNVADTIGKHFAEILAPKHDSADVERDLAKFQERYELFLENDCVISITDNPMGHLSYTGPELIDALDLPVNPNNLMVHVNTFHRKTADRYESGKEHNEQDLDILLQHALAIGVKYLLCVSGDGSERLPRLRPEDLGYDPSVIKTVTSVQALEYIRKAYPGMFTMAVAFNHYEPFKDEMEKLERKLAAGAELIITQPVVMKESGDPRLRDANRGLREMLKFADSEGVQVVLEAWMSQKMAGLLPECVGHDIDFGDFEPYSNLEAMREAFPGRYIYLSMIFGPQSMQKALAIVE